MPQIVQLFETSMVIDGMDFFRTVTVPADSLTNPDILTLRTDNLLTYLELKELPERFLPSRLPEFLARTLKSVEGLEHIKKLQSGSSIDVVEQLCNEAAFGRLIPFQESPLDLHSLADLAIKATGVGLGAYVGFVASGGTPLILITVPAGMILCGAAAGFGRALEEGLRTRLLGLMGVPEKDPMERIRGRRRTRRIAAEYGIEPTVIPTRRPKPEE